MALVRLRGPLRALAGGRPDHQVPGATVGELLRELERAQPAVAGWILDERGLIRRHINVFVNGELRARGRRAVADDDRVDVLPAISGGCEPMTELLVGTKKGLFVLEGEPGGAFDVTARAFAGEPVEYAMRDPRTGRVLASRHVGASTGRRSGYADDPAGEWQQAEGVALPEGGDAALERIWVDRRRRGRRHAVRRRRPGRPVREPRRRRDLGAEPHALGAPDAAGLAAGRRRAVPALDRAVAGRPGPARARDLRGRRLADRRRRRDVAPRQRGPRRRATCPRTRGRARSTSASTTCTARRGGPSGCSCSSTAASTAPTTRARSWTRHRRRACRRTSASRWRSTPPTPTAPT